MKVLSDNGRRQPMSGTVETSMFISCRRLQSVSLDIVEREFKGFSTVWLTNQFISVGLEPVLSHVEKSFLIQLISVGLKLVFS